MGLYDSTTARIAERNVLEHLVRTGQRVFNGLFGITDEPALAEEVAVTPIAQRIAELTEAVERKREGRQG